MEPEVVLSCPARESYHRTVLDIAVRYDYKFKTHETTCRDSSHIRELRSCDERFEASLLHLHLDGRRCRDSRVSKLYHGQEDSNGNDTGHMRCCLLRDGISRYH